MVEIKDTKKEINVCIQYNNQQQPQQTATATNVEMRRQTLCYFLIAWLITFNMFLLILLRNSHGFQILDFVASRGIMERWNSNLESFRQDLSENTTEEIQSLILRWKGNLTIIKTEEIDTNEISNNTIDKCTPTTNIVFVKTHKTGSSTITNILNRFADLRELTVALPAMGDVRFAWPRKFHWSHADILRLDGQPANILDNHARYNRKQMDLIMADNTQYITILRNPVTQFESSFYYFEFDRVLRLRGFVDPIEKFLEYPDEYLYNMTLLLNDLPETINLIQSGMFYDLGYDFVDSETEKTILKIIEKLEEEFQLVLIMEYFDESLVLLKLQMCWEIDDILYIKQNQRSKHLNLTDGTKKKILEWSHADNRLYQHFNRTLWQKISRYGDQFWTELREFKNRNRQFQEICSPDKITIKGFKINVDVSSYVMNPKVDRFNRYLCQKVLTSEVEYLLYFRKKFGMNSGYQKILMAEGLRPLHKENILQRRINAKLRPIVIPQKSLDEVL